MGHAVNLQHRETDSWSAGRTIGLSCLPTELPIARFCFQGSSETYVFIGSRNRKVSATGRLQCSESAALDRKETGCAMEK